MAECRAEFLQGEGDASGVRLAGQGVGCLCDGAQCRRLVRWWRRGGCLRARRPRLLATASGAIRLWATSPCRSGGLARRRSRFPGFGPIQPGAGNAKADGSSTGGVDAEPGTVAPEAEADTVLGEVDPDPWHQSHTATELPTQPQPPSPSLAAGAGKLIPLRRSSMLKAPQVPITATRRMRLRGEDLPI